MKKIVSFFACLLCIATLSAQNKPAKKYITIKGKVNFQNPPETMKRFGYNINKVYLGRREGRDLKIVDSFPLKEDGLWRFRVDATRPRFYELDFVKWEGVVVWADADMTINCRGYDTSKYKIKNPPFIFIEGSADNNLVNFVNHEVYRNYQEMVASTNEKYNAGLVKDTNWAAYLKKEDPLRFSSAAFRERIKVFVRAYKSRPVVLYAIRFLNWEKDQDFILPVLDDLEKKYPWFKDIEEYKKRMEDNRGQAKLLKPGMPVPVVEYKNPMGQPVSVANFKGKYLLIDFWASWCGPCRKSIPRLKEMYDKYRDKGFEVLSISIDKDEKAWRKAMKEEAMPWAQTLSPDANATMDQFLFYGIPTLYLVDREGKIVQKYTGYVPEVKQKIEEIFGF